MSWKNKKNNNPTVMVEKLNDTQSLERIKVEPTQKVDPNKDIKTSKNFDNMSKEDLMYNLEFNKDLTKAEKKQIKKLIKSKK